MKPDWIGWVATAAFTTSYFVRSSIHIRAIQIVAASLWLSYGFLIGAKPVIIANVLVVSAALFSLWRDRRIT